MYYWLALIFFALGLMSKPMPVTFPFLLLLLDYWPLGRMSDNANHTFQPAKLKCLMLEKAPFLLLAAGCSVVTFLVQRGASAITAPPLSHREAGALISYVRYIGKILWPSDLAVLYPRPPAWPAVGTIAAAGVLICLSVWALLSARKAPFVLTGWFWFLGTLVPVIGIIQIGSHSIADRYTYFPSVGLFIVLAWGLERGCHRRPQLKPFVIPIIGAVLIACLWRTSKQIQCWKNSETLFRHALAVTDNNSFVHVSLGIALENDQGRLEQAFEQYAVAARIDTNNLDAIVCEGLVLNKLGRLDEAIRILTPTANRVRDALVEYNLAGALAKKGLAPDAEQYYRTALAIKPDFTEAHYDLALMLAACFRLDEARQELNIVLKSHPERAEALLSRAGIAVKQGRLEEAAGDFQSALRLQPGNRYAQLSLAKTLLAEDRFVEASRYFGEVVNMQPGNLEARRDFGYALARSGRLDDAFREFSEIVRLKPEARAYADLGAVMEKQGRSIEAVVYYRKSLVLNPDYPPALNNLAWLFATHPDPLLRDGAEAVRLAERADQLTQSRQITLLGTLAAAYAEAGRYDQAVAAAERACGLAEKSGEQNLLQKNRERLALYRAHRPYHETANPEQPGPPPDNPASSNAEKLVPASP